MAPPATVIAPVLALVIVTTALADPPVALSFDAVPPACEKPAAIAVAKPSRPFAPSAVPSAPELLTVVVAFAEPPRAAADASATPSALANDMPSIAGPALP